MAKVDKDEWGNENDDKPVLHRKQHDGKQSTDQSSGDDPGSNAPSADPDRPTLHKKTSSSDSGSDSSTSPASTSSTSPQAQDPDHPTLHKKTSDDDSASGGAAPVDPDRPNLKKKTEKPQNVEADEGHVESVQRLSDPDRPKLMRGKPAEQGGKVLPSLMGLPAEMHQVVAVSDAKNRPEHLWSYSWANPADQDNMRAAMEDMAREALGPNQAASAHVPVAAKAKPAASHTGAVTHAKAAAPATAAAPLQDEQFRVYELAYGSGATMVLTARTDGEGANQKFITLICQPNIYGKPTVLLKNVTDAAHLDETPRMRLVDAVDVMADNRGELLFELRGATQRQFALYRVLRGQATRLFVTGPGSIVPETADSTADPHS
jgi:hypothetical protein